MQRVQWFLSIGFALACSPSNISNCTILWADSVVSFSSENSDYGYNASNVLNVSNGDYWEPARPITRMILFPSQYLWVSFGQALWVVAVGVHEYQGNGATVQIAGLPHDNATEGFVELWSGVDRPIREDERYFAPNITCTMRTQNVILSIRTDVSDYIPEISEIALHGSLTKPSFVPECNFPSKCTPSYCQHEGQCVSSAKGLTCICKNESYYGNNCELLRVFPTSLGNFTLMSAGQLAYLPYVLGGVDDVNWYFHLSYAPRYVFLELNLPQSVFVHGFRVYGQGSEGVSDLFILSPQGYWQQLWQGVATPTDGYVEMNVSCSASFRTSAIRVHFTANIDSNDDLDAFQVIGRDDTASTAAPCVNRCASPPACFRSRCMSGAATAGCACLSNANGSWSGPLCTETLQFATTGALVDAEYWKEAEYLIEEPIGFRSVEVGFALPVYVTSYIINYYSTVPIHNEVFVSAGNNQYVSIWNARSGAPFDKTLCQPNFTISKLALTYDFPLECDHSDNNCVNTYLTAVRLTGNLVFNKTFLPVCANPCASSLCMNNATCFGHSNNTFRCECTPEFGGRYCNVSANYAVSVVSSSFTPGVNASTVIGPPDEYIVAADLALWKFSSIDTGDSDFLELQFASVDATALQLFEGKSDEAYGYLSSILVFVFTPFPHYEQVLLINTPNGEDIDQRIYIPAWSCRPMTPTSRVRLEFSRSFRSDYDNYVDAARLFSTADGPSALPPACVNRCNTSFCGVGGDCVSRGTQVSCICRDDFTGTRCEFQSFWMKSAVSSSDVHANNAASLVVGPPDAFPEIDLYNPRTLVLTQWSPLFDKSWLEVEANTSSALFVDSIEFYANSWGPNVTVFVQQDNNSSNHSFIQVWQGSFGVEGAQRFRIPSTNFSCNPGKFSKMRFEFSDRFFSIDAIRLHGSNKTASPSPSTLAACAASPCSSNPCQNNGVCVSRQGVAVCECLNGFFGAMCESQGMWWASQVRDFSSSYFDQNVAEYYHTIQGGEYLVGRPSAWRGSPLGFRFEAKDQESILNLGTIEFVEVAFPSPVYLSDEGVRVIELGNFGSIVRVSARMSVGAEAESSPLVEIWRRPFNFSQATGVFQPSLSCRPSFPVDSLRIEVDVNLTQGWEEYDAVALIGSLTPFTNNVSTSVGLCDVSNLCTAQTCLHDGVCLMNKTNQVCLCNDMWRGVNCEMPTLLQTNGYSSKTVYLSDSREEKRVICAILVQGNMTCSNGSSTFFSLAPPSLNVSWMQITATSGKLCVLDSEGYVSCFERWTGTFLSKSDHTYYSISANPYYVCGITRKHVIHCDSCKFDKQFCPIHLMRKHIHVTMPSLELGLGLSRTGQVDWFWNGRLIDRETIDYPTPIESIFVGGRIYAGMCYIDTNKKFTCRGFLTASNLYADKTEFSLGYQYTMAAVNEAQEVCALTREGGIRCRNSLRDSYNIAQASKLTFPDSSKYVSLVGPLNSEFSYITLPAAAYRGFCALAEDGSVLCRGDYNKTTTSSPVKLLCDMMNGGCSPYAKCANIPNGVTCGCFPGFNQVAVNGYSDCVDINECAADIYPCPIGQICVNSMGSFTCRRRLANILAATGCGGKGDNSSGVWLPVGCSTSGQDIITVCGSDVVDPTGKASVYALTENGGSCNITQQLQSNVWLNTTVNARAVSFFCPQLFSFSVPISSGTRLVLELPGAIVTPALWYSYAPPFVSNKSGCATNCSRQGLPRPLLKLHGGNFGVRPRIFIGGETCRVVGSLTQSDVTCEWPEGKGLNLPVVVLAGDQTANPVTVSYAPCPPGTENELNSTDCIPCKPGFVRGSVEREFQLETCELCELGTFANGAQTECRACGAKTGLQCAAGQPVPAADYWGYYTAQDFIVMRCPPGHCVGANQCAPGRAPANTNMLCAHCAPPLAVWGNQCMMCESANGPLLIGLVILFEVFFLFTHFTSKRDRNGGMPKLMVYFVQIALVLAGVADVHLSFLGVFDFDLARASTWSASCLFPMSVEAQIAISLFMPIWLLLIVWLNFCGQWAAFKMLCAIKHLKAPLFDRFFRTSLTMLVFCYSATCTKVFQLLECVDTPDGGEVLLAFPTIDCEQEFYQSFRPIVILMLAVYILGFPTGCVALLLRWKRRGVLGADDASYKSLNFRWGVWYMAYRSPAFYWQSVELLRRFGFAIVNHLANTSRGLAFSYLNLAALLAHMLMQPYVDLSMNKAEMLTHIVLLCLSLLVTSTDGGSVAASWIFFLLVILTIAAGISYVVFQNFKAARTFFKTRREAALSRKEEQLEFGNAAKLPRSASAMPHDF